MFDAPLLYEAGCEALCDKVLFVDADKEIRIKRIMERDMLSQTDAKRRAEARSLRMAREKADFTVMNNFGRGELEKAIDEILKGIGLS